MYEFIDSGDCSCCAIGKHRCNISISNICYSLHNPTGCFYELNKISDEQKFLMNYSKMFKPYYRKKYRKIVL